MRLVLFESGMEMIGVFGERFKVRKENVGKYRCF